MLEMYSPPTRRPPPPTPRPGMLSSLSAGVAGRGWLHGALAGTGGGAVFTDSSPAPEPLCALPAVRGSFTF